MEIYKQQGFTLVELVVTLAVAALLLGIGIPSFSGAISNSRINVDYNEFVGALYLARSESVKSGQIVTVCPKSEPDAQTCSESNSAWENGWLVFIDEVFVDDEASAQINPEDELIAIHPEPRSQNVISAWGSTDRTSATSTQRNYIRYTPNGSTAMANGSIHMCNDEEAERSRAINISPTGDVRKGRASGGTYYPRDVFGAEVCTL